ncbi:PAS domain S-box protein [Methanolobus bombayensis]|uniref:PAS domain S-box protein n=1 Tax=Methanolobus bombayensis TaxID=38023 RepID=UPI001AE31561|nr:PAS domain S-box protein [Methanolobus bombayensis]MBP1910162.1 PAS domain S-box-containing protein [Methanolobus bombayensis]
MSASSENTAGSVLPELLENIEQDLFTRLNIGIICFDEYDQIFYSNTAVQDMTGLTAEELMMKRSDDFLFSDNKEQDYFSEFILSSEGMWEKEKSRTFKIIDSKGNLRYLTCEVFSLDGTTGSGRKMCLLRDDTIRTVCANESSFDGNDLKASHLPFVSFLWRGDDVWSVEYVSENISQFGYSPDEFVSGNLAYADIVHPDHLDSVKDSVEKCMGNHFSKEYMIRTADGEKRWVLERSYAVRDNGNDITHFHGAILDISERKEFEHEMELMNLQESALSRLGEKALSCSNISALMDYTLKLIADTLGIKYSLIMEVLEDGNFLLRYGYGLSEWCIGSALVEKDTGSPAGYTALTGIPLIIEDLHKEERFFVPRYLHEHGIVSSATVIIGERGNMYGVLCVHSDKRRIFNEHDINFLQSAANILAETIKLRDSFTSLELYRNLINQSSDYIMVLNAITKKFIYVSDRIFDDLGYSRSEVLEKDVFNSGCIIAGCNIQKLVGDVAEHGHLVMESELLRKDGSSFPAEISFSFVENEGITYIVLIGRDITEKKKAGMFLRESETKMRAIFDNASDLICLFDTEGRILEVNRAMKDILGMQEHEFTTLNVAELLEPEIRPQVPDIIAETMEKEIVTIELEILKKDGSSVPLEVKLQMMEFNGKKRMFAIGRDISERRVLESAIREHAQQLEYSNEVKDMFADITSHDLLGSVSLIEGFAGYLEEMETDEEKKHLLENVVSSTAKLKKTIDSASLFARLNYASDMTTEVLDLQQIYYSALERLLLKANDDGINIELNSPMQCNALVNPIIEEVFYNLLSNAIKYSPRGGRVNVEILNEGDKWRISVSDEGPGIPEDYKEKIFDRFQRVGTSRVSGQGLGLTISRMALKCHGEELFVSDNGAGQGSTFWFTVPMADR